MTEYTPAAITEDKPPCDGGGGAPPVVQGKYELGRVLGHGTFGKVYLARNVETGKSVAMKVIGKEKVIKVGMVEQLKREISVMKKVKHPNIVELHEVMASKSKIYLAMELVRGGELFSKVSKGRLREDVARSYFSQLISAVDFCHSRGVYHRDLKLENLLLDNNDNKNTVPESGDGSSTSIDDDSNYILKVTDFGLSALSPSAASGGMLHTTCGTPAYVAPEVIANKGYDGAKADIWSCGVILYVLLAGFLPFQDDNLMAMYRKIYKASFRCPPWFSPEARRLVTKMLDPNPMTRITIAKIMEAPWLYNKKIGKSASCSDIVSRSFISPEFYRSKDSDRRGEGTTNNDEADQEDDNESINEPQPETLNAFHIISLSQGFNLSPLFEEKKNKKSMNRLITGDDITDPIEDDNNDDEGSELRFATSGSASSVISKLEQVAANTGGRFQLVVRKKGGNCNGDHVDGGSSTTSMVRLQGQQSGRKGKLSISAEILPIAPSVLVVEVRKQKGDTLEYNRFCNQELRPALKDIQWKSSPPPPPAAG